MKSQINSGTPKIWGGIECTINRVGGDYKDQLIYSGHYERSGDIEAIAKLGIEMIRYPVLWEKHQPAKNIKIDWHWTDHQLNAIYSSGMNPIVGLLHHGSGPSFTNLLDPDFPYLFADYAYEVASRYPWVENYTPVNEPLTTARFSGLYGLWYPHCQDESSFYKMVLNQLKATVFAMEAIRSVNPAARLIQTEDLGKTHSTPLLSYQATFENDRRGLTFDILTGVLGTEHPQYGYIIGCGITEDELQFFLCNPCVPDIIGLNYYITSERWLDENVEKYNQHSQGGNGRHRYSDTEVVRANNSARTGFKKLAAEVWERYRIPLAVTEVHLHCTREDQLRWLKEIWDDAIKLKKEGIDIKGVTAWAMLGSFDWDSLLTKTGTQYESGVFDIKTFSGKLRPTALANLVNQLVTGRQDFHPVLAGKGWWNNTSFYNEENPMIYIYQNKSDYEETAGSPKLVSRICEACKHRRLSNLIIHTLNISDINHVRPWAIINTSQPNSSLENWCSRNNIQYTTWVADDNPGYGLRIITEQQSMTVHQINKVLDLMIDGEQGSWIFDAGEIIYKADKLMDRC